MTNINDFTKYDHGSSDWITFRHGGARDNAGRLKDWDISAYPLKKILVPQELKQMIETVREAKVPLAHITLALSQLIESPGEEHASY